MIRVQRSLKSTWPLEECFSFLADFANLPAWDPGIVSSRRSDDGELRVGSSFHVVARFLGRRVPMTYQVVEIDPPTRIVLQGTASTLRAIDEITFERDGRGCIVHYRADFHMVSALRWAEPLLKPAFDRLATRAMDGMAVALRKRAA
jgi:carbon monoxide dehydrogenase subunit G